MSYEEYIEIHAEEQAFRDAYYMPTAEEAEEFNDWLDSLQEM